jgi:hypothetical protein
MRRVIALLHAAVASVIATTACSSSNPSDNLPDGFTELCKDGRLQWTRNVTGAPAYDSIEIRLMIGGADAIRDLAGKPCASATRKAECEARYAGARSTPSGEAVVVTTRGDAVDVTPVNMLSPSFFGTVDTPEEAAVLVARDPMPGGSVCELGGSMGYREVAGGYEIATVQRDTCSNDLSRQVMKVGPGGIEQRISTETLEKGDKPCAIEGRRPCVLAGETSAHASSGDAAGWLARAAYYEAASVPAFVHLARELAALDAPADLVARCEIAAREEMTHARAMIDLCEARGGGVLAPEVGPMRIRGAFEVAMDNAVEGCVNETFAAMRALYQSRAAVDADVRRAMAAIADDEAEHAQLSWDIAEWIEARLTTEERLAVDGARRAAMRSLLPGAHVDESSARLLGLPDASTAAAMSRALVASLSSLSA